MNKAASDMQPPATVLVDIRPAEEEILAAMKPKTRYNIRLASKKGVEVSVGSGSDFDAWYRLYRETSARDRIAIHAPAYYRGLFERARTYPGNAPDVKLLLARHEGGMLAGNIVILWKTMGIYLTGASSNERRNLMPTYALQWAAVRMAKAAGCEAYDLYGCPPAADESHPMFGLYQFKTGFSPAVTERWGTWDVPLARLPKMVWQNNEALTADMARGAREYFDTIDRMGGMVAAIERGYPQREVAESAYRFQQAVERNERIIVGVNDFVEEDARGVPTLYIDEAAAGRQTERVRQLRKDRDNSRVRRALDELKRTAEGQGNTMVPLIEAARAYATVGEMCDALRDVWGEYVETPTI